METVVIPAAIIQEFGLVRLKLDEMTQIVRNLDFWFSFGKTKSVDFKCMCPIRITWQCIFSYEHVPINTCFQTPRHHKGLSVIEANSKLSHSTVMI